MVIDAKNKSSFIFPAAGVLVVILAVSLIMAAMGGDAGFAWFGAAISALPMLILFGQLMLRPVPRTSENLPLLLLIGSIGVLIAAWQHLIEQTTGWAPMATAMFAMFIFIVYVYWYSRFGRFDSPHLSVGGKLPAFTLTDTDGNAFESTSLLGSPAVLMFYRGNWCPLCMAQIREIADRYQDLDALGIKVCLVSPQPDELSRKLAGQIGVPFRFLVDQDNKVAEELGIAVRNGVPVGMPGGYSPDTVLPTLVMTNDKGTILFSDQTDNYRVRPEPDVFLAILRRSGVVAK